MFGNDPEFVLLTQADGDVQVVVANREVLMQFSFRTFRTTQEELVDR